MKKDKKELYFWKQHFNINSIEAIPQEMEQYVGIDSDEDDQFFYYLTSRVTVIHSIDLRCTFITNESVKYISKLKELKKLSLRNHTNITKDCLPFLNQLSDLIFLDLSKTSITLDDLAAISNLQNLRELHLSSDDSQENISQKISALKKMLPHCIVTVNQ